MASKFRYRIQPFRLTVLEPDFAYVYTQYLSCKTKSKHFIQFLETLSKNDIRHVDAAQLETMVFSHKLSYGEVFDFLHDKLKIIQVIHKEPFLELAVHSDSDLVSNTMKGCFEKHHALRCLSFNDDASFSRNDVLHAIFITDYDNKKIGLAYEKANQTDSYFITAYLIHKYALIDNVYIPSKGLPCHFCFLERMKLRVKNNVTVRDMSSSTWMHFYEDIIHENEDFVPHLPITDIQLNFVLFHYVNKINALLGTPVELVYFDDLQKNSVIDFLSGQIFNEFVSKWPCCRCNHF